MNKKTNKKNKGFSLVELIIVIAIMAILAAVLAPQFAKYLSSSKKSSDIQNAQMIASAVSAQVSEDQAKDYANFANGTDLTYGTGTSDKIAYTKVNSSASLVSVIGRTVNVKLDKSKDFYIRVDNNGNVIVYISSSTTASTSDIIYPDIASGSSWK